MNWGLILFTLIIASYRGLQKSCNIALVNCIAFLIWNATRTGQMLGIAHAHSYSFSYMEPWWTAPLRAQIRNWPIRYNTDDALEAPCSLFQEHSLLQYWKMSDFPPQDWGPGEWYPSSYSQLWYPSAYPYSFGPYASGNRSPTSMYGGHSDNRRPCKFIIHFLISSVHSHWNRVQHDSTCTLMGLGGRG